MRNRAVLLLALTLACATAAPRLARHGIDWTAADDRWSVHLVTQDPTGRPRVTRIWLAMLDGVGVIRTGESRWAENLQANPDCRLRTLGVDYPLRAEFVTDPAQIAKIDAAFLEKYGWQERMISAQGHQHFMRLLPAP